MNRSSNPILRRGLAIAAVVTGVVMLTIASGCIALAFAALWSTQGPAESSSGRDNSVLTPI